MFAVPMRVRTGPRVLLSMVHCTFAGAPVFTVHHSATLEPGRTSTVAGAVTVGDSKREKRGNSDLLNRSRITRLTTSTTFKFQIIPRSQSHRSSLLLTSREGGSRNKIGVRRVDVNSAH